ncbi:MULTISPECIES: S1C family serine protease [unclassified Actinotalea]|uniref:S1C family serine protease n=1 Tax=unclassified Actinotalea TaxID=2638618 RepID=UPI001C70B944|nr:MULTISPECIES: trypsin-like peptidase domain-containing protein [unclassified Actinotalea]
MSHEPFDPKPAAGPHPPPRTTTRGAQRSRPSWWALGLAAVLAAVVGALAALGLSQGAAASDDQAAATVTATADDDRGGGATTGGGAPDWVAVAEEVEPTVVAIDVRTASGGGAGSGVMLGEPGRVVTNHHVVAGAVDGGVVVTLHDGRMYQAEIVGTDEATDLAVLRLVHPPDDLRVAELADSDAVRVGQPVAAIGNPLGLSNTLTTGTVSALDRPTTTVQQAQSPGEQAVASTTNAIQVDAPVNPGNSGGPLFDAQGRVIGINSSIASLPTDSGGQAGSIGLGFAIPSDVVDLVTSQLDEDGVAEHAYLGVALDDTVVAVDDARRAGAEVLTVEPGSPADQAGLRPGDVVIAIDGDHVSGAESLIGFIRQHAAGDDVALTVVRDGTPTDVDVTLAVREDAES